MKNGGTSFSCHPGMSLSNDKTREDPMEVPKVVIENTEESTGFSSSVFKVLSMQRFYTKSVRKSRDTWLQKYAYHRANEEREWRRPLMRKSPSPSPQPESPASDQAGPSNMNDEQDSSDEILDFQRPCCMPLVIDPSGDFYFCWLLVVSLGVLYNYWAIILFVAYPTIYTDNVKTCFGIDYAIDSIFLLDILVQFRTGFLQDGIMECQSKRLAAHYVRSWGFVLDILSVVPFDLLYLVVGLYPVLRVNRFLKVHRYFWFCDRGEIYSGRPKLFNLFKLIQYLFLIIHWVACLYFILSRFEGFGRDAWIHPKLEGPLASVSMQYLYSLYRSSVSMTTVGTVTSPNTILTMLFVIVTYLCGVLIFATIVGNAGDMIVDMRRPRELYLRKLNGMKAYITAHQLSAHLKRRVILWFDYLWTQKRDMDEEQLFATLNENFKAEIAIHVNLETLIKVEMFQDCDPGFLHDLVLKLKPSISSPGDFVCRQGERGREMYIVNKGQVEVLDEMETILATLIAGTHFGEISLLNMKGIGDRRTASVRSVGFTDLFRLSKDDLDKVLLFYPDEKSHMEKIATKTFERQQQERRRDAQRKNVDLEGSSLNDPRIWFSADTATLRRRLSWVESVNNLRRFASRIRKKQQPSDQNPREILQEFSQKAQQQRSKEESRRIVEDFVAEIRAREEEKAEQNNESGCPPIVNSNSSDSFSSAQLSERLRKFRNMTKRSSCGTFDRADTAAALDHSVTPMHGRPLRPRSFTTGLSVKDEQPVLNFQILNRSSSKSLAKIGSFCGKRDLSLDLEKTSPVAPAKEKVLNMFGDSARKALRPKNIKLYATPLYPGSSFVVSKEEALESLRFKGLVCSTMERKRKWFEGNDSIPMTRETKRHPDKKDEPSQNSKDKSILKRPSTGTATKVKGSKGGLEAVNCLITLPAIKIENNPSKDGPKHQRCDTEIECSEVKEKSVNSSNSSNGPQNTVYSSNSQSSNKSSSSNKTQNATLPVWNNNNKPKGKAIPSGVFLQNKEPETELKYDEKVQQRNSKTTVALLHQDVQCACSEESVCTKSLQAPESITTNNSAAAYAKKEQSNDASNTKEVKKPDKEKQARVEETCC